MDEVGALDDDGDDDDEGLNEPINASTMILWRGGDHHAMNERTKASQIMMCVDSAAIYDKCVSGGLGMMSSLHMERICAGGISE